MLRIDAAHCRDTAFGVDELCSGMQSSAAVCPSEGQLRSPPRPGHCAKVPCSNHVESPGFKHSCPGLDQVRPTTCPRDSGVSAGSTHPRK